VGLQADVVGRVFDDVFVAKTGMRERLADGAPGVAELFLWASGIRPAESRPICPERMTSPPARTAGAKWKLS
jgi:hypothetical protein